MNNSEKNYQKVIKSLNSSMEEHHVYYCEDDGSKPSQRQFFVNYFAVVWKSKQLGPKEKQLPIIPTSGRSSVVRVSCL
jgi:hypothetical protein